MYCPNIYKSVSVANDVWMPSSSVEDVTACTDDFRLEEWRLVSEQTNFLDDLITEEWCTKLPDSLKQQSAGFEFRDFSSPRIVALPRLKSPVCRTIYPLLLAFRFVLIGFLRVRTETQTATSGVWTWVHFFGR